MGFDLLWRGGWQPRVLLLLLALDLGASLLHSFIISSNMEGKVENNVFSWIQQAFWSPFDATFVFFITFFPPPDLCCSSMDSLLISLFRTIILLYSLRRAARDGSASASFERALEKKLRAVRKGEDSKPELTEEEKNKARLSAVWWKNFFLVRVHSLFPPFHDLSHLKLDLHPALVECHAGAHRSQVHLTPFSRPTRGDRCRRPRHHRRPGHT